MYHGSSIFCKITHLFSSLVLPRIGFLALKCTHHQGVRSLPNPLSDQRKSLPNDSDIAPHSLGHIHLASLWLPERFIIISRSPNIQSHPFWEKTLSIWRPRCLRLEIRTLNPQMLCIIQNYNSYHLISEAVSDCAQIPSQMTLIRSLLIALWMLTWLFHTRHDSLNIPCTMSRSPEVVCGVHLASPCTSE